MQEVSRTPRKEGLLLELGGVRRCQLPGDSGHLRLLWKDQLTSWGCCLPDAGRVMPGWLAAG